MAMDARKRPLRLRLPLPSGVLLAALLALALVGGRAGAQTPPAAPTIDSVTEAATSLTVAWSAPSGVTGITAYDVRYITTAADETAAANWTVVDSAWTTGALQYTITALEKGTEYDVQVRAVTTVDGEWSATTAATTTTTAPGATTLDAVTAGEGALGVAWSEPADTGGAKITSYDIRYRETGASGWTTLGAAWQSGDASPTDALTRVITELTAGTEYDVQVRASNSEGDGGWSDTVTGTPVTDHGDRQNATDLALGSLTSGSMGRRGESDWFRLVVAERTEILLLTHGSLDTFGELWKGQQRVAVDDDGGIAPNRLNFAIATRLEAATYHLSVHEYRNATGDYLLEAKVFPETTGRGDAIPLPANTYVNQIIGVSGDRDWFTFTLEERSSVVLSGVGQGRLRGRVVDPSGTAAPGIASISVPGTDFLLTGTLAAGTWYLEVRGTAGTGIFHARLDNTTKAGDSLENAGLLTLGGYTAGRIDDADDVDYIRIDFSDRTKAAYVRVSGHGAGVALTGELLDSAGEPLPGPVDIEYSGSPRGFTIKRGLAPGVYYLKVTRAGGSTTGAFIARMVEDGLYAQFIDRCEGIATSYSDPLFGCQWNLQHTAQFGGAAGEDINVAGAWSTTMGEGVTVTVVDDGVQLTHEDLVDNADAEGSHDFTGGGLFARYNTHGTAVAGIVAARDNDLGVRGVAPRATIRGVNLLRAFSDANEAYAATHEMATMAVNTNSWGHGTGFKPSTAIWRMAVERGITEGYGGKGVFYVWSAGNSHLAATTSTTTGSRTSTPSRRSAP